MKNQIYSLFFLLFLSLNVFSQEEINHYTFEIIASPAFKEQLNNTLVEQSNNKIDSLLQLMENVLNYVNIALVVVTFIFTVAGFVLSKIYREVQKSLVVQKKKAKEEEEKSYRQHEEVDLKIQRAESHLRKLDDTDVLITTKISAIQKSLLLCLEKAPSRNIAFSTYSKLLSAYEILLNNSHETISNKLQEEMEMAATVVSGNKQYVPKEIIRFMIESMNLPYEVRGILWREV